MRTFLITYDLAKPNRNKHALASVIMSLGSAWARPLEQTWFVRSEESASELEERLTRLLDTDDGLIVQQVEAPAVFAQTSLRWFRQRRPGFDVPATSNVIAFPTPERPLDQHELPLAQTG
jgi:hypothetical protein